MKKTGYHYTSYDNWQQIKRRGLVAYKLNNPATEGRLENDADSGVWLWRDNQKGRGHVGCILFQVATKNTNRVVKLAVEYDDEDLIPLLPPYLPYSFTHQGSIGKYTYGRHGNRRGAPSVVHRGPVTPNKIKLVGHYDVRNLLK